MKGQEDFGDLHDERPFDFNFGEEGEWGRVLFPDDTDVVHCVVHKARAEVIVAHEDRDEAIELARNIGVWRESTIVKAPLNVPPGGVELPNNP